MSFFSKNLRFLRKRGNHNQDDIARMFNKRANTIGNWENQKSEPSLEELMKLGDYFNVSSGDLLQKDMEKAFSENPGPEGIPGTVSGGLAARSFGGGELPAGLLNNSEGNAFWMILRELRSLNEKVDLLEKKMESSAYKMNPDKSSY